MPTSKELSLEQEQQEVWRAFDDQLRVTPPKPIETGGGYLVATFDDYIIASFGDEYFKIPYSQKDDEITFAPKDKWVEMEKIPESWREKTKSFKAVTKKEKDGNHPASHYLVVEDPEKTTTWHLRVRNVSGDLDHRLMGAAWAALHGGYRGNKYEGPGKQEAIRKLRKLYSREDMEMPDEKAIVNNLKALSKTEKELRVANYIVLFGGRDLEGIASSRKNPDGSIGEYFTPETALESSYTKTGMIYVDWEHGQGKELDGEDAPGPDDVLGYVDWKTAKTDDNGVWVERVLNRKNEYMQFLEVLIDEGIIGNSSEAITDDVEKKGNGEITHWPLRRDTLTVQPMEPRMMTQNVITAIKALAEVSPNLEALLETEENGKNAKEEEQRKRKNLQLKARAYLLLSEEQK